MEVMRYLSPGEFLDIGVTESGETREDERASVVVVDPRIVAYESYLVRREVCDGLDRNTYVGELGEERMWQNVVVVGL